MKYGVRETGVLTDLNVRARGERGLNIPLIRFRRDLGSSLPFMRKGVAEEER